MEVHGMLKIKEFKPIPGFSKYSIFEDGTVYSNVRNKIIAKTRNWAGYWVVTITDDNGYRAPRKIHRLVYSAYVGPLEDGKVIDHKDDDKDHNHYTNLQQITPSENSTKSFITGLNKEKVVWTKEMIHSICKMMENNTPNHIMFKALNIDYDSNRYNCNHLIGDLKRGTMHKDVTSQYDLSRYINAVNKKDAKLTEYQVQEIYMDLMFGVIPAELARHYKTTHNTICKIRDKRTWCTVTDWIDNNIFDPSNCI